LHALCGNLETIRALKRDGTLKTAERKASLKIKTGSRQTPECRSSGFDFQELVEAVIPQVGLYPVTKWNGGSNTQMLTGRHLLWNWLAPSFRSMEQVAGGDPDTERIRRLPHAIVSLFQSWHEIHSLFVTQPPDAVSKLQSAAIMLRGVLSANFSDSLARPHAAGRPRDEAN
jgi:hypothetical protein